MSRKSNQGSNVESNKGKLFTGMGKTMKELKQVSEKAWEILWKIPPRYWSKSMFSIANKCDVLVNNMSETFNSVILGPRGKPIVTMIEDIRGYLMERWVKNREKFSNLEDGVVLPNINKKLLKEKELSRYWMCR